MMQMTKTSRNILTLFIIIFTGILIYRSPDESHYRDTTQEAIKTGRAYAYKLLISDKRALLETSFNPAKDKITGLNLKEPLFQRLSDIERVNVYDRLMEKQIPYNYISPLSPIIFAKNENEIELELLMFSRYSIYIVMTFAYKSLDCMVAIPEKGKMLFSVAMRYYEPTDERLNSKLIRKIANLPLLKMVVGRYGTTGRWLVFDYNYKYNLNDYLEWINNVSLDWLTSEREKFIELKSQLKTKQGFQSLRKSIIESAEMSSVLQYDWANSMLVKQIEQIEKLLKDDENLSGSN